MKNPYVEQMKAKSEGKKSAPKQSQSQSTAPQFAMSGNDVKMKIEGMLRKRKLKRAARGKIPWLALLLVGVIFVTLGYFASVDADKHLNFLPKGIEIHWLGQLLAATKEKPENSKTAESAAKPTGGESKNSQTETADGGEKATNEGPPSEEEMSYFSKLRERKQELDRREQELARLEEELQKQKVEIEGRIRKLASVRDDISKLLSERVKVDQERVGKLVEFYSNMKPQQAASIVEKLDEDLAVEILVQMKKKNAAEIINLLQADKARKLSEKFAGYAKR